MNQPRKPATTRQTRPGRLGDKRALFQALTTLTILGIPFLRIDGDSLLRLDFPTLTLHAFGARFPVTDLPLFLLLALALTLTFLLVTLAFGRAWCGWACPQTTLVDLLEWFARRIGVRVSSGAMKTTLLQKLALQGAYAFLALLVGANFVWYFVAPADFFPALFRWDLHWVAVLTLAIVAATVYLDLALLRRVFCRDFCPYGRFQAALIDAGTLTLHFHPDEAPRCIRCGACVRTCPTGIDIREGENAACINCGRCLDACREVMAKRGEAGIIRYTFGLEGKGFPALFNLRMALVALACLGLFGGLIFAAIQRDTVSLKVARNATLLPRLVQDDRVANFFTVFLVNRSGESQSVRLAIPSAPDVELSGAATLHELAPHATRRLEIALLSGRAELDRPRTVELSIIDAEGTVLAKSTLYLTRPLETHD